MKRQLHSRKGVTVAEVVIALVIIAAISAFTLSLIVMSIGVETKSESAIEVKNAAENAIECFRFANGDKETFWTCLERTGKYAFGKIEDGVFSKTENKTDANVARLDADGCVMTITWEASRFSFVAERGGEQVYRFKFPEGGTS